MSELFQDMLREKEMTTPTLDMSAITGGRGDVALEDVLSNSSACAMFKKFAESEFCVEPLLFWCVFSPCSWALLVLVANFSTR